MASGNAALSSTGLRELSITAWFKDCFGDYCFDEDTDTGYDPEDDFVSEVCNDCKYYFNTYSESLTDIEDSNGNPATEVEYRSLCPCKRDGISYVRFPCVAGHDGPTDSRFSINDYSGSLPAMAFRLVIHPKNGLPPRSYAWMQASDPVRQLVGPRRRSINTFSDDLICWGNENSEPMTLEEAVTTYTDAKCNADLLKPHEFVKNLERTREDQPSSRPPGVLIGGEHPMAVLADSTEHTSAYLLLRGSGIPMAGGVCFAGLWEHQHDGMDGFITTPDRNDRCWFLIPDPDRLNNTLLEFSGLLLGQIPNPIRLHSLPCSSHAPSSSEPAALAAS